MQLRDAEAVGVEDDHGARVGHVDPDLDDGRGDEHVELARGETGHHLVLLLGAHAAVQRRHPHPGQRRDSREQLEGAGDVGEPTLRLLVVGHPFAVRVVVPEVGRAHEVDAVVRRVVVAADARAHDIGLASCSDLLGDPRPGAVDPARVVDGHDVGGDRLPASRQLAQGRGRHVTEDRESHSAWDRGRRHDEQVRRVLPLRPERVALLDPEAVLLVDDDETEVGEGDHVLEQRVGADDDPGHARGDEGQGLPAGLGAHRPGEQLDPGRVLRAPEQALLGELTEHGADRPLVLGGEHLGRGEQDGLGTGVDDREHGTQRHDRLA